MNAILQFFMGKKKKAMIKRIMHELRVEINNKPSLKKNIGN